MSLQAFVVQFNIRFIDLLNKPKCLLIVMDHPVISFEKLDAFHDKYIKIVTICSKTDMDCMPDLNVYCYYCTFVPSA